MVVVTVVGRRFLGLQDIAQKYERQTNVLVVWWNEFIGDMYDDDGASAKLPNAMNEVAELVERRWREFCAAHQRQTVVLLNDESLTFNDPATDHKIVLAQRWPRKQLRQSYLDQIQYNLQCSARIGELGRERVRRRLDMTNRLFMGVAKTGDVGYIYYRGYLSDFAVRIFNSVHNRNIIMDVDETKQALDDLLQNGRAPQSRGTLASVKALFDGDDKYFYPIFDFTLPAERAARKKGTRKVERKHKKKR